jgi:hypothetical protein
MLLSTPPRLRPNYEVPSVDWIGETSKVVAGFRRRVDAKPVGLVVHNPNDEYEPRRDGNALVNAFGRSTRLCDVVEDHNAGNGCVNPRHDLTRRVFANNLELAPTTWRYLPALRGNGQVFLAAVFGNATARAQNPSLGRCGCNT